MGGGGGGAGSSGTSAAPSASGPLSTQSGTSSSTEPPPPHLGDSGEGSSAHIVQMQMAVELVSELGERGSLRQALDQGVFFDGEGTFDHEGGVKDKVKDGSRVLDFAETYPRAAA